MQQVMATTLSNDYSIGWTGAAYQELATAGTGSLGFVFGLVMVFLILAAQYERWSLPLAVLTAVPFAVLGALIGGPRHAVGGALIGASGGAIAGAASDSARMEYARQQEEAYAARDRARDAQLDAKAYGFRRAMSACMEGRSYSVR